MPMYIHHSDNIGYVEYCRLMEESIKKWKDNLQNSVCKIQEVIVDIVIKEAKPEDADKLIQYTKLVGAQTDNLSFGKEGAGVHLRQKSLSKEFVQIQSL